MALLAVLTCCAIGAANDSAAGADDPDAPLSFDREDPLALAPGRTTVVGINNNTGRVANVRLRLNMPPRSGATALAPRVPRSVQIQPGATRLVDIDVEPFAGPPATYSGTLSAWTEGAPRVIRLRVNVVVLPERSRIAATPEVRRMTITVQRVLPLINWFKGARPALALDQKILPHTDWRRLAIAPDAFLGTLSDDSGRTVSVRFDNGIRKLDNGLAGLVVRLDGLREPGIYEGSVNLLGPGAEAGVVHVRLRQTDYFLGPTFALILGIIAALWATRFIGLLRGTYALREKEAQTANQFDAVKRVHGTSVGGWSITDGFEALGADVRGLIDSLETARFASVDDQKHQEIEEKLRRLRDAVEAWRNLPAELAALRAHLEKIETAKLPTTLPPLPSNVSPTPAFLSDAVRLLQGRETSVEEFLTTEASIRTAIRVAESWSARVERISESWLLSEQIHECRALLGEREKQLDDARGMISGAYLKAVTATTVEQLVLEQSGAQLDEARESLSNLTDVLPRVAPDEPTGRAVDEDHEETQAAVLASAPVRMLRAQIQRTAAAAKRDPQARMHIARRARRRWQAGLAVIALLVAVLTGLDQLYFEHEFGTVPDYLKASLWGFGTKIAIDGLVVVAERLLGPASWAGPY